MLCRGPSTHLIAKCLPAAVTVLAAPMRVTYGMLLCFSSYYSPMDAPLLAGAPVRQLLHPAHPAVVCSLLPLARLAAAVHRTGILVAALAPACPPASNLLCYLQIQPALPPPPGTIKVCAYSLLLETLIFNTTLGFLYQITFDSSASAWHLQLYLHSFYSLSSSASYQWCNTHGYPDVFR